MGKGDKTSQTGMKVLILVAMVAGTLIGLMTAQTMGLQRQSANGGTLQGKMGEVMALVEDKYVDAVDPDSLSERLLAVMLSELDPHSTYLTAKAAEENVEMLRGSFEGVGLMLRHEGDTTYVGHVMAGGPSDGLGIMPGDKIMTIDGDSISGMPSDSVVARLRGPRGSRVALTVDRMGSRHAYSIRRGVVDRHSINCTTMLDDTTGYIALGSFAGTSHDEFRHALRTLRQRGMRRLVFDLRGNGGGSLQSAVGIAGELLPAGSLIVYTRGAHSMRHNVYAHPGGLFPKGEVIVLVDENSASASEVVSGALQDNDRALIVGRRTFGKGLVQTEYDLSDGSSVLLTTARYYTPSGRCIQRSYADGTDEYYREYINQLIDETYADSVVMHINDSTPYKTVGGRTVYGGGGIQPDVVLTYRKDSSFIYYNQLSSKGLLSRTAFAYVRRHAGEMLGRYADAEAFSRWNVPQSMIDELVAAGERDGIKRNPRSLAKQRKLICAMLKAYTGSFLYGDDAFYDACLPEDNDLDRALKLKNKI